MRRLSTHSLTVTLAVVSIVALLAGPACSGVGSFTITRDSDEQVVEGEGPLMGLLPIDPLTFEVNLERELEKRDAKGAKAVYLDRLVLKVTDTKMPEGDTDNFDFLESMTFYANSENLDENQIATIEDVPQGQQTVELNVNDSVDLKPYVQDGLKLETEASGNPPEDDTSIKGTITLDVKVL